MKIVKDYMRDDTMRHALNELTARTFGFDFESWVMNGYFEGDYIPYSFEEDGKVISNVSVNLMKFQVNEKQKNYIQIGTVMTDEHYRRQGLARKLMEQVISDYQEKCDGIYLFANLEALDFYRKLGFQERHEYRYGLKGEVKIAKVKETDAFIPVKDNDTDLKKRYLEFVRTGKVCSSFEQVNKYGLQLFYTAGFENVYYSNAIDCFCVMEMDGDTLEIQSVLGKEEISLEKVIGFISQDYQKLRLGFTPKAMDAHLFEVAPYDGEDDYRLFCIGEDLARIEKEQLYFPTFSHA